MNERECKEAGTHHITDIIKQEQRERKCQLTLARMSALMASCFLTVASTCDKLLP